MTNEENELLLKDLCARLPYGVKCHFKYGTAEDDVTLGCIDNGIARFEYGWYGRFHVTIDTDYIKPYLRPMSSMTNEEKKEYDHRRECMFYDNTCDDSFAVDWLNAHHFDYRRLIEKGLALEAKDGMYGKEAEK